MNTITCKKPKYWDEFPSEKVTTKEWCAMPVDWLNEHKLDSVYFYFFRYDNYFKGLKNSHIMKSVFGRKEHCEIIQEIDWWFNVCVGVYSEIELNKN